MSNDQVNQLQINGETTQADLSIQVRANAQFDAMNPIIVNGDMLYSAIRQLTDIEHRLNHNLQAFYSANGGEDEVLAAIKEGEHEKIQLARFKLELVRSTIARFTGKKEEGEKAVEDFVKLDLDA